MTDQRTGALSEVLDRLEGAAHGDSVAVDEVLQTLGPSSFASLMLVFSLISLSPASAIPGITAMVAAIVFILAAQMLAGRDSVWLPRVVTRRRMPTAQLCEGIRWLRRPVRGVERVTKPRLGVMFRRPFLRMALIPILGLTLFMPLMEAVPTSGSIASAVIALFAAGLLMRDGGLVLVSMVVLIGVPVAFWQLGPFA